MEVLVFVEVLGFEDVFDLEVDAFGLEVAVCLEDAVDLEDVAADLADVTGLAVPPEANEDEGFCLALVPRLAEDISMIGDQKMY